MRRCAARGATVYAAVLRRLPRRERTATSVRRGESRECWRTGDDAIYGRRSADHAHRRDRHRSASARFVHATTSRCTSGTLYAGYPHRYCHYRKTFGYANMPLDGVWLRAPYLHNGSVPTLRDLLEPAASAAEDCSIAATTSTTRSESASSRTFPKQGGRKFFDYDTAHARQLQRRARRQALRHGARRRTTRMRWSST